ncbi:hypothetical protein ACOSP7_025259 [Xanthoceras sorbifolium]
MVSTPHWCRILEKHNGTFRCLEKKKLPAHLDWFGWSTWDAFYTRVDPVGIEEGLKSFAEGGRIPKCLFIDDGWQNTEIEPGKDGRFAAKLANFEEKIKFKSLCSKNS